MVVNEYHIYGIIVSLEWYEKWKLVSGKYIVEVIKEIEEGNVTVDDISCVFYGHDGKFLIIGKILQTFNDEEPIIIDELNVDSKSLIESSVKKNFGLNGEFNQYFVKTYNIL